MFICCTCDSLGFLLLYYINIIMNLGLPLSVAFDEDFEGELADNNDARLEVSVLSRSPDPELTEVSNSTFE